MLYLAGRVDTLVAGSLFTLLWNGRVKTLR